MKTDQFIGIQLIFLALLLLACGTFQFGIERTPTSLSESTATPIKATPTARIKVVTATPEFDAVATLAALSTANAHLIAQIEALTGTLTAVLTSDSTQVSTTAPPTPMVSPTPATEWMVQTLLVFPGELGRLYALRRAIPPISAVRLLTSDDFGQSWQMFPANLPVEAACLRQLNLDYATLDALYASTCQGLYRWSDSEWQFISSQETGMVAVVFNQPKTIWATTLPGSSDTPVLRSDDGGQSWNAASRYLGHTNGVANLVFDPQDTNLLYAVIWPEYAGSYLRRGTANGQWETMPTPLNDAPLGPGITLDGHSGGLYVINKAESSQLWRSPNPPISDVNTIRWEQVYDFGPGVQVELLTSGWSPQGLALYANLTQAGQPILHRSLDGGQTWVPLPIEF